ncbi:SIR2 family protein [Stigmatella sp. ncwal1]|uniref:SIR2 family protein n=1 Tax=Stigmatella ashevillensis TaxID=2995309 RepID=A0ABT5D5I8_9BACT|nr:SIR2 family protein [Stigmatella ashevillena]MDC0708831.1 SIR2 family protein [Stigmatella ashevillena]
MNPYNCSAPGRSFVGYQALLTEVLRGFVNEKSYALVGGRRCGKTSLLMKLRDELSREGLAPFRVLPRLLDIQAVVPRSPFEFFSRIHALLAEGLAVPAWDTPPPQQTYQEFLRRLDALQPILRQAHGDKWLAVLLLDELDVAPKTLPDDECFQNLRNLLTESRFKSYFRVVASGCSGMGSLIGSGSPLNNLDKQYTRVLTVPEARELVARGFPEELEAEAENELLSFTGGHPYALQGLLEWLHEKPNPVTREDVQSAAERFARSHGDELEVWYRDLGEAGRTCYEALARAPSEGLTKPQLRERVAKHFVNDGLLSLSYHGLIHEESSGQKRIVGSLFKDWFLDHSNIGAFDVIGPVASTRTPEPKAIMAFTFPQPLLEAYRSKKLALCVGSGLSLSQGVQGNFPTWKELPRRFIDACAHHGMADNNFIQGQTYLFKSPMSLEPMLAALGVLSKTLGPVFYQRALTAIFRPKDVKPGVVHEAIAKLGVRTLLTTNYDELIEELGETPRRQVYTWKESDKALQDLKEDRPVLLKIHGTAHRADTVVMTELEYHQARADRSYQAVLSHLFQGYTFLFLGYGMNDPLDLDLVLKWNAESFRSTAQWHYALMKQPSDKEPRAAEWERYQREYNVQALGYRDHGDLELIVEQLAQSAAPNEFRAKQEREGNKGAGSESASKPQRPLKPQTSLPTALASGATSPGGPGARAALHDKVNQIREDLLNRNWPHREAAYCEIRESNLRGGMRRSLELLDEKWKGRHGPLEAKDRAMVVQIWADTKNWSRWDELIQLWSSEIAADSELSGRLNNYFYAALASDMVWALERIREDLIALKASGYPERPTTAGLLNLVSYVARKEFGKPSGKAWDLVAEIYEMFRDEESRFSFLAEIRRVLFPS